MNRVCFLLGDRGVLVELRCVELVTIGVRRWVSAECRQAEGGVGIGRNGCGTDENRDESLI